MIAIPVDKASMDATSSKLFGNVQAFALYNNDEKAFRFIPNGGQGDGVKTAKLLADLSVTSVVYSFMGNGPYGVLEAEGIGVYYLGKEPLALSTIVEGLATENYVKVVSENAQTYLDPGTASGECGCGCSHD
ncbi:MULTISPECIES: NifB/NifX family molybdenum-iron cluster-binding protein [Sulfurimonas]|uniref:NifB/NifX family molybdenum-iron cluster-binding protein n=1 Tax=Sulfurimonas diazotrophicus TaxID=3131939 RepID=A0ABZ3H7V5_9BACT